MNDNRQPIAEPTFIIIMGVAGSGKTTIGRRLAERLGWPFYDGDDYHPPANIARMAAGVPLDDEDRAGWLAALAIIIREGLARGESGVVACSALKQAYRGALRVDDRRVQFVYLKGDFATIQARLLAREGHYMRASLLQSQFNDLEEPRRALHLPVALHPDQIVDQILRLNELTTDKTDGHG